MISELHTQPACAPVSASPVALRQLAHDSGSGWFATPFLCGSFIRDSEPVYPGAFSDSCPPISWTLRFSVCSTWGQVSLIHAPGLPAIPSPNTCGRSASSGRGTLPPQRVGPRTLSLGNSGLRRSPGWLASPPRPNRVQFPPLLERLLTDWPFTSRCSPPCLTARPRIAARSQLRSLTGYVDLERAFTSPTKCALRRTGVGAIGPDDRPEATVPDHVSCAISCCVCASASTCTSTCVRSKSCRVSIRLCAARRPQHPHGFRSREH